MNASIPSSVQPPHAAQNPLIWFALSFVSVPGALSAIDAMWGPLKDTRVYGRSTTRVKREQDVEIVPGVGVGRVQSHGLAEMLDRLVSGAPVRERRAEVPVCLRRARVQ